MAPDRQEGKGAEAKQGLASIRRRREEAAQGDSVTDPCLGAVAFTGRLGYSHSRTTECWVVWSSRGRVQHLEDTLSSEQQKCLLHLAIGHILPRKASGGRRAEAIRELPAQMALIVLSLEPMSPKRRGPQSCRSRRQTLAKASIRVHAPEAFRRPSFARAAA